MSFFPRHNQKAFCHELFQLFVCVSEKNTKYIYKFHTIQTFIFTKKIKNDFCHESPPFNIPVDTSNHISRFTTAVNQIAIFVSKANLWKLTWIKSTNVLMPWWCWSKLHWPQHTIDCIHNYSYSHARKHMGNSTNYQYR